MIPYYIMMAIIAYLIGSINFSILISKKNGFDIREKGSGNAGSTNMLRTMGKGAALITLILDILKGVVTVWISIFYSFMLYKLFNINLNVAFLVQIAGLFVILGHTFPIYFGFKGGKGVATTLGILLVTNWHVGLICLVFALVLIIITKMVSVGALGAAILFPVLTIFSDQISFIKPGNYIFYSIAIALIVCFNHKANIQRLMNGTENKISFKKKKEE